LKKPLLLINIQKDNSTKSIDDVYLKLVEHDVARLISSSDVVSVIDSINKGELWKTNDSQKRQEFLQNYFNYGNSVNFLNLIE